MNDKEELKNDEIVESGNKSDEKLVSRAPGSYVFLYNNSDQKLKITDSNDYFILSIFKLNTLDVLK